MLNHKWVHKIISYASNWEAKFSDKSKSLQVSWLKIVAVLDWIGLDIGTLFGVKQEAQEQQELLTCTSTFYLHEQAINTLFFF
jgi:hypothetical protein